MLDVTEKIAAVAFAAAIPLLAALVLVGQQEVFRRRATTSTIVLLAKPAAQGSALVRVVASVNHIGRSCNQVCAGSSYMASRRTGPASAQR